MVPGMDTPNDLPATTSASNQDCKFKVGELWKTRGGWTARVVWVQPELQPHRYVFAVHKPGRPLEESCPIAHDSCDGAAIVTFAINDPPTYNGHPADLVGLVAEAP